MLNASLTSALAGERRRDQLAAAARQRALRAGRPPVPARTRARLGRTLIAAGLWLVGPGDTPEGLRPLALGLR
jgi:hypothetical protein